MLRVRSLLLFAFISIIHAKLHRKGNQEELLQDLLLQQRQHNLGIIPLVEADDERSYQLHQTLYSLLWLKRRIAGGTDKLMKGIPEISFWNDPHFYRATVSNFWIDYKGLDTKTVNVTIEVLKITNVINNLHILAGANKNNVELKHHHHDQENGAQHLEKAPEHGTHHYIYYVQGNYHCRNKPTAENATKCDDSEYYLDAVYVQIFPVLNEN